MVSIAFFASILMFLHSPEQSITRQLCSVNKITVEYTVGVRKEIVTLNNPKNVLAKTQVTKAHSLACSSDSVCRISFGDLEPLWLWANETLTTDDASPFAPLGLELSHGFISALNEEVSKQTGYRIDVLNN